VPANTICQGVDLSLPVFHATDPVKQKCCTNELKVYRLSRVLPMMPTQQALFVTHYWVETPSEYLNLFEYGSQLLQTHTMQGWRPASELSVFLKATGLVGGCSGEMRQLTCEVCQECPCGRLTKREKELVSSEGDRNSGPEQQQKRVGEAH